MNIRYTLPDGEMEVLAPLTKGERIEYCVPFDLDKDGKFNQGGWVAVTRKALYLLGDGKVINTIDITTTDEVLCSSEVDNGILVARKDGQDSFICRFSMRYMIQNSYLARGATLFCRGQNRVTGKILPRMQKGAARNQRVPSLRRCRQDIQSFLGPVRSICPALFDNHDIYGAIIRNNSGTAVYSAEFY